MEKENYDINYIPKSMSFISGFMGPRGNVGFMMKLDRDKARHSDGIERTLEYVVSECESLANQLKLMS